MGAGAVIGALAIGGGVAALLVSAQRKKAAAAAAATLPSSACDALKNIDPAAYQACKGLTGFGEVIAGLVDLLPSGPSRAQQKANAEARDARNTQLNGPADVVVPWELATHLGFGLTPGVQKVHFANGCAPFEGHPGAAKCAPGTELWGYTALGGDEHPVASANQGEKGVTSQSRSKDWNEPSIVLSGVRRYSSDGKKVQGDPFTGYINTDPRVIAQVKFPLAVPPGGIAGYFRGKPFVCPAGNVAQFPTAADHTGTDRSGGPYAAPTCVPGNYQQSNADAPAAGRALPEDVEPCEGECGGGTSTSRGTVDTNDFCFVDGFWQRKYQGKCPPSQNPTPVSTSPGTIAVGKFGG
jgi:hypothetical protein